jgi:hypothetical protein
MADTTPATRYALTLVVPPSIEEKLIDLLLGTAGNEVFTSVPVFSHGTAHGRLNNVEQVMGRSAAAQVQIIVTENELNRLLEGLRRDFRGTGLRYWAHLLTLEGEVQ